MSTDNWLALISEAIGNAAKDRETTRAAISAELEKRVFLFIPYVDGPEGHGVGWIRGDTGGFIAFRRHSNGYEMYPMMQLEDDLVRKLAEKLP